MADERDPGVSQRYRELGAEEPPRALDEAILAASRKAVRQRNWYGPMAIAAVLTLAIAVTVQLERQKPDEELVVATAPPQGQKEERAAAQAEKKEQAFSGPAAEQPRPFTPEPPPTATAGQKADAMRNLAKSTEQAADAAGARERQAPAEAQARNDAARDNVASVPASPPVVAQAAPAPAPEPVRREMGAQRPQASVMARGKLESKTMEAPETALERIAELRKQGKHEEADKALAEFRKQYPDYRLSDEMRAKVEKK